MWAGSLTELFCEGTMKQLEPRAAARPDVNRWQFHRTLGLFRWYSCTASQFIPVVLAGGYHWQTKREYTHQCQLANQPIKERMILEHSPGECISLSMAIIFCNF